MTEANEAPMRNTMVPFGLVSMASSKVLTSNGAMSLSIAVTAVRTGPMSPVGSAAVLTWR